MCGGRLKVSYCTKSQLFHTEVVDLERSGESQFVFLLSLKLFVSVDSRNKI